MGMLIHFTRSWHGQDHSSLVKLECDSCVYGHRDRRLTGSRLIRRETMFKFIFDLIGGLFGLIFGLIGGVIGLIAGALGLVGLALAVVLGILALPIILLVILI